MATSPRPLRAWAVALVGAFFALLPAGGARADDARAGGARADDATVAPRRARPWTVSGAANVILPSAGVELAWQASPRVEIAAQVTQLLIAHVDASLRLRMHLDADAAAGIYLGVNGHAWYSPLILHGVVPVATAEVGWQSKRAGGLTWGMGVGAGTIFVIEGGENALPHSFEPLVIINLRIGRAY